MFKIFNTLGGVVMVLSTMSFEEKSVWVSLLVILMVFTGYFSQTFEGLAAGTLDKSTALETFVVAVIAVIVLEIALHIVISNFSPKDADSPRDERDRLFAMRAGNISGYVLGFGVLVVAVQALIHDHDALWSANFLLFAVFVSQIASYALQLFYYRRGY